MAPLPPDFNTPGMNPPPLPPPQSEPPYPFETPPPPLTTPKKPLLPDLPMRPFITGVPLPESIVPQERPWQRPFNRPGKFYHCVYRRISMQCIIDGNEVQIKFTVVTGH